MGERDVLAQKPPSSGIGHGACGLPMGAGVGVDAQTERAGGRPARRGAGQVVGDEVGGAVGQRGVRGARAGEPGGGLGERPALPSGGGEGQHGPEAGIRVGLERGLDRPVVRRELGPVHHGGDPGLERPEEPDERGRVQVVGPERGGRRPGRGVAHAAEQRPPGVPVGVDEARHDDRVGGVDHLGVAGPDPLADLGHTAPVDQDVALAEVRRPVAEREHAAPSEQELRRHRPLPASTDLATVS